MIGFITVAYVGISVGIQSERGILADTSLAVNHIGIPGKCTCTVCVFEVFVRGVKIANVRSGRVESFIHGDVGEFPNVTSVVHHINDRVERAMMQVRVLQLFRVIVVKTHKNIVVAIQSHGAVIGRISHRDWILPPRTILVKVY